MTWRDLAWRGVGMVWCGVTWRGHGVAWRDVAWAWRRVAWRGVAWRGVVCRPVWPPGLRPPRPGKAGLPQRSAYSGAKAALLLWFEALGWEEQSNGIHVPRVGRLAGSSRPG